MLFSIALFFPFSSNAQSVAKNALPGDILDFDASVGFETPRLVTILNGYDRAKNIFYIFPSAVDFVLPQNGAAAIGLQVAAVRDANFSKGSFTFTVRPRFNGPETAAAIDELRRRFPNALFAYPVPSKSILSLTTIEQASVNFSPAQESSPLANEISFTAKLTPIETRVLLLPQSLESPSATFQFIYYIRGVSRDPDGSVTIIERPFLLGGVLGGFCAPFPAAIIDAGNGRTGCAHVTFDKPLVREIQRLLRRSKDYLGPLDGIFGSLTEEAIRDFQKRNGVLITGYPTRELRDLVKSKNEPPAASARPSQ